MKAKPCRCKAYDFPHRYSLVCHNIERVERVERDERDRVTEKTQADNDAEELALFNRAESRAINSGAW